jgi:hypothetical protein
MSARCWTFALGVIVVSIITLTPVADLPTSALVADPPASPFVFRDVGDEAGLFPAVAGIAGHAVAWGDIDNDGWPDLLVGTFGGHPYGSKPCQLFRNLKGKFQLDDQPPVKVLGRGSGCVFADLDNDGDLDLYYCNHAIAYAQQPHFQTPNFLFRNEGGGQFTDVSVASGARPGFATPFAGRSATALDYDGDGLLDLLVGECIFQGGQGRSRLYRNLGLGGLRFQDVSKDAGLPDACTGLGVAAGDVNGDGWPDIFLAGRDALKRGNTTGNHLLINDRKGRFREVPKTHADFTWQFPGSLDEITCGVCIGDVNRDGLADIVIGHHFDMPWARGGTPIRLYLNRGIDGGLGDLGGLPRFEDVTEKVGLHPLLMKAPHVEIQDFDNDGWPDIYVSIVKFAGGKPYPVIFRNLGVEGGLPRFRDDAWAVNDFPSEAERQMKDVHALFEKIQKEQRIIYMAAAPSCDFDRDGRLDLFLANWWVNYRSLLLKNETPGGHWLQVQVTNGPPGAAINRMGVGSVIRVYPAGQLGKKEALLRAVEISPAYGYSSGQEAIAHIGLGKLDRCDVEVILPHGKGRLEKRDVKADQRMIIAN